jgi:D-alanyl-D-alanine carboxypeptidase
MDGWLKAALDYIPEWLDYRMRISEQPGCTVAVAHKGRVVLEEAFGSADLSTGRKLTPRHRFRVASHSKSFTAAAIFKLREAGRLGLDDSAGRYVDGLHPEVAALTLSQLLSHSSGLIRDGIDAGQWQDRRPFLSEKELRRALKEPPLIAPSSRFKYSNHGFGLAGLVIEAVTGEPYGAWVAREIVAAARLDETQPDGPAPRGVPVARGHTGKLPLGRRRIVPGDNPTRVLAPATGFVSTAGDLARFFASLDPAAKHSILSPASRRDMIRQQWSDVDSSAKGAYGLGIMLGQAGDWQWFGHAGGFQSCISRTVVLPGRDLAVSILTNSVDGPAWAWSDGLVHILQTFAERGPAGAKTRDWAGRWWSLWRTLDFVPMRDHVLVADPTMAVPFTDAAEIAVEGRGRGTIRHATGLASYGEGARLVRGADGKAREIWFGGTKFLPEKNYAAELKRKYRD